MANPSLLLRRDLATLEREMRDDLERFWRGLDSSPEAAEMLHDVLPGLVDSYGAAAATLTADWYDDLRESLSVRGRFEAVVADISDSGANALVGWALASAQSDEAFKALVLGGTQRRVLNFSRLTVTTSSTADPFARGWRRVGLGRCDFCRMLIGRGAVYSEATAHFDSHDNCACNGEPDFA